MDWQTILASITASSVIAAAIGYVIKKSYDRALDLRFERLKEQNKGLINEEMRRRGSLFDEQYSALKTGLSLVYRLSNKARDAMSLIESEDRNRYKKCTREVVSLLLHEKFYLKKEPLSQKGFLTAFIVCITRSLASVLWVIYSCTKRTSK